MLYFQCRSLYLTSFYCTILLCTPKINQNLIFFYKKVGFCVSRVCSDQQPNTSHYSYFSPVNKHTVNYSRLALSHSEAGMGERRKANEKDQAIHPSINTIFLHEIQPRYHIWYRSRYRDLRNDMNGKVVEHNKVANNKYYPSHNNQGDFVHKRKSETTPSTVQARFFLYISSFHSTVLF